ncbi:MAG: hypothetical protein WBL21_07240 [Salinimicrobium sp.]
MPQLLKKSFRFLVIFLLLTSCAKEELDPNERTLGSSSQDFLTANNYTSMTLEIVYVEGFAPKQKALDEVKVFLNTYLNKPGGINIILNAIPSPEVGTYTTQEVVDVEAQYRSVFSKDEDLGVFVFFADNYSAKDVEGVSGQIEKRSLGTAYRNTSIVIFEKSVMEISYDRSLTEHTTLRHELGHLFGLVNNGTPALSLHEYKDPNDPAEKGHCNVENCLMSATLDFSNSAYLTLGEQCHQDLLANGGK